MDQLPPADSAQGSTKRSYYRNRSPPSADYVQGSTGRSYYRDTTQPDERTPLEKIRDYYNSEKRRLNASGRRRGRPPGKSNSTPTAHVWKMNHWQEKSLELPEINPVTPCADASTSANVEFMNHNPTSFFNLLDEFKKYGHNVNSLNPPISSRELVEQNIEAYMNYFPTSDLVAVSLVYPMSLLEEKLIRLSLFLILEPKDPESLTYNPIHDLVSIVKGLFLVLKSYVNEVLLQSWLKAVKEKDLNKFNKTFVEINAIFRHAYSEVTYFASERLGDYLCQQAYYHRVMTPNPIGSDPTYGGIISHIPDVMIQEGCLTETSHFVDMGDSIGNMVSLMSIRTGCSSFGVEIMTGPSLAEKFVQQSLLRAQACRLRSGKIQFVQGDDVLNSELVKNNIVAADVVLVNNRAFCEQTDTENLSIARLLGNLKDGAKVFTLAPLTFSYPMEEALTLESHDHPGNIFRIEKRMYPKDSVSWSHEEGPYYIHTVNKPHYETQMGEFRASRRADWWKTIMDS